MKLPLESRVRSLLKEAEPALGLHGGSVSLERITPEGVVELRFLGACVGCAAAEYTLEYGLKELILLNCDDAEDVVAVNDEPVTHAAPAPRAVRP